MKNFIIVLVLFANLSFGQTKDQIPEPDIDLMLENIDKSELISSFLYDRTTPIANLTRFNAKDKNTASLGYFEQALQELYRASNKTKFKPIKEVRKYYKRKKSPNSVDIGVLHVMLQSLNYNSKDETLGALRLKNNQLTKINDKPVFLENDVLVVSPLLDYAVGNTINYRFNPNLWFEDCKNKITSIVANFDTGKDYLVYSKNKYTHRKVSVNYVESGYKTLKFTVNYSDGEVKITYGKLHIKLPETNQYRMMDPLVEDVIGFVSNHPFQGYDENAPIYGQIDYRIFYHTNNGNTQPILLKPIVIIDGFDPGDKRKTQDEDSPKPPNEHNSIEEMMIYFENGNPRQIIPILRDLGYDVVIVNHPTYTRGSKTIDGGADYIERNAMNHITLYQHLNNKLTQNGSNEKLVIVGPSMGGQISRYALAYMEKNNIDHNTRLWVSIDSPHLGANIPMGIQSMINLLDAFGGSVAANDFYYNQLKSTAANQQLIEQHKIGNLPDYLNGGSPIHQQYYTNLSSNGLPNSNGYPQNLRKVTIVNGSLSGTNVGMASEEDFRIHGFLDQIIGDIKVVEMNTKYMPNTGGNYQVARLWRALKPLRTASYTNNNPHGSLDIVPGGIFNSEDEIHSSVLGESVGISDWGDGLNFRELALAYFLGIWGDHFESRTNKEVHSFIPTVSALGFKNPNFNWGQKLDRNLLCNNEIPFDSYFGPKINERHTSFTEESVNWLLKELDGNEQDPHFPLSSISLTTLGQICNLTTLTYNSCDVPGAVQTWTTSSNLQVVSSNDYSVTVDLASTYSRGGGWIKSTFNNGQAIQKDVWVGKPSFPQLITNSGVPYNEFDLPAGCSNGNTYWKFKMSDPLDKSTELQFSVQGGVPITKNVNNGEVTITAQELGMLEGMTLDVKVRPINTCGSNFLVPVYKLYRPTNCECGIGINCNLNRIASDVDKYTIFPNPTNDYINIVSSTSEIQIDKKLNAIAKLYDMMANEKKSAIIKNNKGYMNVANLPLGLYILKIYTDEKIENHIIAID